MGDMVSEMQKIIYRYMAGTQCTVCTVELQILHRYVITFSMYRHYKSYNILKKFYYHKILEGFNLIHLHVSHLVLSVEV